MFIILFILILAVLVFVHELGHFWSAKKSGIRVDEFAIGFPPKIISYTKGETVYKINAVPFGGYVKIFGEDPSLSYENESPENKARNFQYKSSLTQIFVLVSGVLANILFAFFLIWLSFIFGVKAPLQSNHFGNVKDSKLTITSVLNPSPAYTAGIKAGDEILFAESKFGSLQDIKETEKLTDLIKKSDDITFLIKRGDVREKINVKTQEGIVSGQKAIGVSLDMIGTLKLPIHKAFVEAVFTTKDILLSIVSGLYKFIAGAFAGSGLKDVTGPVGIAKVVKEASTLGFSYIISLTALISLNLAVLNMIPFPALDGGRILFVIIEAIIGKKIKPSILNYTNAIGFIILILLMILVTVKDVRGLF